MAIADVPDLMILLDMPAELAMERVAGRTGGVECFEDIDTLRKVRDAYRSLADYDISMLMTDASATSECLLKQAKAATIKTVRGFSNEGVLQWWDVL
jgi:thymidylate kinase